MRSLRRILAIAHKEWRLNLRFPVEYLAANLVTPIKSGILMYLLYRGLLKDDQSLGLLNKNNYQYYVLIGSTLHSLFSASLYTFRSRMVIEKFWQTITGTLVSPANIVEITLGFIWGSGTVHLFVSGTLIAVTMTIFGASLTHILLSQYILLVVCVLGFGLGLVGTAFSLCWEGRVFIVDYLIQALMFLSCFYYPLETLPSSLHPFIQWLPTYQASHLLQTLCFGSPSAASLYNLVGLSLVSLLTLCLPAFFLDHSVKKYGMVGY